MKKLLVVVCILVCMPVWAGECNDYKGLCFSSINYEMYKYPIVTWNNHNKTVNWHAGAEKYCNDMEMRLPSKEEINILADYLYWIEVLEKVNIAFWLKETATGQIGNVYINENNKNNAYVFNYNSLNRPIRTYLSPTEKTSGFGSSVCTICVKQSTLSNKENTYDENKGICIDKYTSKNIATERANSLNKIDPSLKPTVIQVNKNLYMID